MPDPVPQPYTDEEIRLMHHFGFILNEDKNEPSYDLKEWIEMARLLSTIGKIKQENDRLRHDLSLMEKARQLQAGILNTMLQDNMRYKRALKAISGPDFECEECEDPEEGHYCTFTIARDALLPIPHPIDASSQ